MPLPGVSAAFDLGLGDMLSQQQQDETDDERKKRLRGMSDRQTMGGLFDFGRTGIASIDLAMPGAGMGSIGGRR